MEKTLQDYFLKGFSKIGTVANTGINKKTVSKYFRRWDDEWLEEDKTEFEYGFNTMRSRIRVACDFQLKQLYKIQDDLNHEIEDRKSENNRKIPYGKGMYKERIKISTTICEIMDHIGTLLVARKPEEIQAVVEKQMLEEHQRELAKEEERRKKRESMRNSRFRNLN